MNKVTLILLLSLALGCAYAQDTVQGVTMSTDPAKAAAVEKQAQELKARQSTAVPSKPASTHPSNHKAKAKTKTTATHKSPKSKPARAAKAGQAGSH